MTEHHPFQTSWTGFYMEGAERTDMEFDRIIIEGKSLKGSGTDALSPFTLEGTVVDREVKFVKQYTGTETHYICYKGMLLDVEAGEQIVGNYYFDKEFTRIGDQFELNRSYEVERKREAAFNSVVSRMKCVVGSIRFVAEDVLQGAVQVCFVLDAIEGKEIPKDTFYFTCASIGAGLFVSLAGPIFECYQERKNKQLAGPMADSPPEVDGGARTTAPGYEPVAPSEPAEASTSIKYIRARLLDETLEDYWDNMVDPVFYNMSAEGLYLNRVNGTEFHTERAGTEYLSQLIQDDGPALELEFNTTKERRLKAQNESRFQDRVNLAREVSGKKIVTGNTELVQVLMEKPAVPAEVVDVAITEILGGFRKHCTLVGCATVYWSYVLLFPLIFPISCEKGVHLKAHLVFMMLAFVALSIEVWAAAHTKLGYLMLIHAPQQYAFSMILSTVARFDAYSDMAFIFMSKQCGSWLWQPSAMIFVIGVICCQMIPGLALLIAGRFLPAALKLNEFNALLMLLKPSKQ